jgi:hypothetical protein
MKGPQCDEMSWLFCQEMWLNVMEEEVCHTRVTLVTHLENTERYTHRTKRLTEWSQNLKRGRLSLRLSKLNHRTQGIKEQSPDLVSRSQCQVSSFLFVILSRSSFCTDSLLPWKTLYCTQYLVLPCPCNLFSSLCFFFLLPCIYFWFNQACNLFSFLSYPFEETEVAFLFPSSSFLCSWLWSLTLQGVSRV